MTPRLLRLVAVGIAVAGVFDPAMTRSRTSRPEVAVVHDRRLPDPALVTRVEDALGREFTVIRGESPALGAAATISIGYQLPTDTARAATTRGFAVIPEPNAPFAAITEITAPPRAVLQARTPIDVRVRTLAASGRTLTVSLRRQGVAIDRAARQITGDDTSERVTLHFVAASTGDAALSIEAAIDNGATVTVDVLTTVDDGRRAVLFFDRRPSWMSTFVRREIEADPRFVVTSRVATSRSAPAVTAGEPPATLSALPSLELFQMVAVGAPDELTSDDASGLDAFMRSRGGTVLLLFDQPDNGRSSAALRQLTGVTEWKLTEKAEPWGTPSASAVLEPAILPPWLERKSGSGLITNSQLGPTPIFQAAIGKGMLLISGALDSWRFRGADSSQFGAFWRKLTADGAERAVEAQQSATRPAPSVEPDEHALLAQWAASTGGRLVKESSLADLVPAIRATVRPVEERRPFYPMRNAWWIVPFAAALGGEWWLRRQRGQR